jgi:murein L,D-transpeptidase YcbB/YkuD/nucleotide-binding universal stress UspA family protein
MDLVVMATHGRGGIRRARLGSVADHLIRTLEIPVLLVRPGGGGAAPDRSAGAGQILVTFDGSPLAEAALDLAAALARIWDAEVTLLQVVLPVLLSADPGAGLPRRRDRSAARSGRPSDRRRGPVKARSLWTVLPILIPALATAGAAAPVRAQDSAAGAATVRGLLASARHPWARWPDFGRYVDIVGRLYVQSGGQSLWMEGLRVRPSGHSAIGQLAAAAAQGLDPRNYDAALLDGASRRVELFPSSAAERARFDLLLTVDLVRFLDDLRRGRLHRNPLRGRSDAPPPEDLVQLVARVAAGDTLAGLVASLEPQLSQYRNLRALLARYRRIAEDATLGRLPPGAPVHPGDPYAALARLERWLAAYGDLAPDSAAGADSRLYRGAIVGALQRFQARNALEADGVLGTATVEALNSPDRRIAQIELALERLRWVPPVGRHRLIVVNIPAFQLLALDSAGGSEGPSLTMRVVVGRAMDRLTPVLLEDLRYVEFRPYWNVPRGILVRELLPLLRRRPGYLRAQRMEVVGPEDRVLGDQPTPALLDRLARGELRVRQRPGPDNALGLAKFVFPNAADVYMHGTPDTALFARSRRDFSHGCIRLEHPAELAEWVLRERPDWPRARIDSAMAASGTTRVLLSRPLPVLVFYTTAVTRSDGSGWFYPDVYGHDRALAEALRAGPGPP